ncbi:MAG: hypothetical protein QOJ39_1152 [Candidatus Eremiobacteraeota bacterium]|jgi:hypothetical protein|nr:hypothetical protein [Candidatus Eremiobacteraeota bacterium]
MLLALVLAFAIPTYGPIPEGSSTPAPAYLHVPVAAGEALIIDSGSTNREGYRLRVYATGWTALQQGDPSTGSGQAVKKRVPAALVKRFFADLKAAGPLDQLTTMHCMKSVSFGSSMQIGYDGKLSPDLTCPSPSSAARALAVDAGALAEAAGVTMLPRTHR